MLNEKSVMKRRGFTLVEMLVAMVLTLILVYALAEFYAYVGETVRDGRALIEVTGQLRGAIQRLKGDLDLRTAPVIPWADDGSGVGYFMIAEGIGKDWDPDGNGNADAAGNGTPVNENALQWGSLYGDIDDVIAFTARNKRDPWTGQVLQVNTAVNASQGLVRTDGNGIPMSSLAPSHLAEIVWWTGFVDIDTSGFWTYEEPRVLHRRQLLVRPDLNVLYPDDPAIYTEPYYFRVQSALNGGSLDYYTLMQYCDVSIRMAGLNIGGFDYYAANSLSDLARRENRFMHRPDINPQGTRFPVYLDLNPHTSVVFNNNDPTQPVPRGDTRSNYTQYRWVLGSRYGANVDRRGEDLVLTNLLAFDIRVFDPTAPIRADNVDVGSDGNIDNDAVSTVQPGDVGWNAAVTSDPPHPIVGFGAFVDLCYGRYCSGLFTAANAPITSPRIPRFAGYDSLLASYNFQPMHPRSQLVRDWLDFNQQGNPTRFAYYDTWAQSYERDGIDQDFNLSGTNTIPDQGTDGLDGEPNTQPSPPAPPYIYRNGVDDMNERETAPPFDYPLRGIEVTIRLYEPGTRQVRQATVGADFIPE
jgi:prepilin-type N-terminal cleavage/methylation domain-containing protein